MSPLIPNVGFLPVVGLEASSGFVAILVSTRLSSWSSLESLTTARSRSASVDRPSLSGSSAGMESGSFPVRIGSRAIDYHLDVDARRDVEDLGLSLSRAS